MSITLRTVEGLSEIGERRDFGVRGGFTVKWACSRKWFKGRRGEGDLGFNSTAFCRLHRSHPPFAAANVSPITLLVALFLSPSRHWLCHIWLVPWPLEIEPIRSVCFNNLFILSNSFFSASFIA